MVYVYSQNLENAYTIYTYKAIDYCADNEYDTLTLSFSVMIMKIP